MYKYVSCIHLRCTHLFEMKLYANYMYKAWVTKNGAWALKPHSVQRIADGEAQGWDASDHEGKAYGRGNGHQWASWLVAGGGFGWGFGFFCWVKSSWDIFSQELGCGLEITAHEPVSWNGLQFGEEKESCGVLLAQRIQYSKCENLGDEVKVTCHANHRYSQSYTLNVVRSRILNQTGWLCPWVRRTWNCLSSVSLYHIHTNVWVRCWVLVVIGYHWLEFRNQQFATQEQKIQWKSHMWTFLSTLFTE